MKKCNKCNLEQSLDNFTKNKATKDGYNLKCKSCYKQYLLKYESDGKRKEYHKEYDKKDSIKKYRKNYRTNTNNIHTKIWSNNNKEYILNYQKEYYKQNKYIIKWRDLLHLTLKKFNTNKQDTTENTLKYSANDLKKYLDEQNMNWETDDIDHKIPLSWFYKKTPVHIVNDLRNLQPLSSNENKRKSNRFNHLVDTDYYNVVIEYIKEEYKHLINYKNNEII